jgi:hypothetical protein
LPSIRKGSFDASLKRAEKVVASGGAGKAGASGGAGRTRGAGRALAIAARSGVNGMPSRVNYFYSVGID